MSERILILPDDFPADWAQEFVPDAADSVLLESDPVAANLPEGEALYPAPDPANTCMGALTQLAYCITRNAGDACDVDLPVIAPTTSTTPVGELGLSPRARNALHRAGITTLGELTAAVRAGIADIKGLGVVSEREIMQILLKLGTLGAYDRR